MFFVIVPSVLALDGGSCGGGVWTQFAGFLEPHSVTHLVSVCGVCDFRCLPVVVASLLTQQVQQLYFGINDFVPGEKAVHFNEEYHKYTEAFKAFESNSQIFLDFRNHFWI